MTAISFGLTRDGFVIAADGRTRLDDETRASASKELLAKETEFAQKIFSVERTDAHLAFAMAGALVSNDFQVDLRNIGQKIASQISGRSFGAFQAYMSAFANNLAHAIQMEDLSQFPTKICDLFIGGYYSNAPAWTCISFTHNGTDVIPTPKISPLPLLYGSLVVASDMYEPSSAVGNIFSTALYIPKPQSHFQNNQVLLSSNPSLDEMQRFCVGYIEACASELALTLDETICRIIGGHIHVAEITPSGFKWRIPPKSHV